MSAMKMKHVLESVQHTQHAGLHQPASESDHAMPCLPWLYSMSIQLFFLSILPQLFKPRTCMYDYGMYITKANSGSLKILTVTILCLWGCIQNPSLPDLCSAAYRYY